MRFQTRDRRKEDETQEVSVMIKRKQQAVMSESLIHATTGTQVHWGQEPF